MLISALGLWFRPGRMPWSKQNHVVLYDAQPLWLRCRALERRPFERIRPAAIHPEFLVVPENEPHRASCPDVGHSQDASQFQHNGTSGRIVVRGIAAATAVHVRGDDVHLSGYRRPGLCGVGGCSREVRRGHEPMTLHVGVAEAPQLFFKPVDPSGCVGVPAFGSRIGTTP